MFFQKIFPYRGTTFQKIGGQKVIDKLVDDFYEIMESDPRAKNCLATHEGRDLRVAAQKLKAFLCGWTGGPQIYLKTYGHPRLRMRHFPFSIGEEESQEWLYCMKEALKKSSIQNDHQIELINAFQGLTELIKNRS